MTRSDQIGNLAAALARAQGKMQHAKRDAKNPHFNSRYADLTSIIDVTEPLAAEELSYVQVPSTPEAGIVAIKTMLMHSSGEWLESDELRMQARDAGPQAVGSCITYGRRYQLMSLIGIAPDDDDNGEAAERPAPRPKPRPVVDITTGEELPVPDAPRGFHYVRDYVFKAPWHEATLAHWAADGSGLLVSTKLPGVGKLLAKAADLGLPIRAAMDEDITMKANRKGEGYLNKVVFYDAASPDDRIS